MWVAALSMVVGIDIYRYDVVSSIDGYRWRAGMVSKRIAGLEVAPVACCAPMARPGITGEQAGTLAHVFKALSDPARGRILNMLANSSEPVCVCDFMPELGLSQPTVSFH